MEINIYNADGVKKMAHKALAKALFGAQIELMRKQKAAAEPTIDSYNELVAEEELAERPTGMVGQVQEHTEWRSFMHLYIGLSGELAALQSKWHTAMAPADFFDLIHKEGAAVRIGPQQMDDLRKIAAEVDVPLAQIIAGEQAKLTREQARIRAIRDEILALVNSVSGVGMTDISTFTAEEQRSLLEAKVAGVSDAKDRFVTKGLASSFADGWGTVRLMKEELVQAQNELRQA